MRRTRALVRLPAMSAPTRRKVVISLDPSGSDDRSLRGRVEVASEPDRPFAGWLGLLSALEAAMESLGVGGDAATRHEGGSGER
jgi:hypothetical protein